MRFDAYEAMAASPEVDAVYVATPHPWHAEYALLAIRAGKAPSPLSEGAVAYAPLANA